MKTYEKFLKVWFPQGEKYLYFEDKKTYEREKRFYGNNNIKYEERNYHPKILSMYNKQTTSVTGDTRYLIHKIRSERMEGFEYSSEMTDQELQDYILKDEIPERLISKKQICSYNLKKNHIQRSGWVLPKKKLKLIKKLNPGVDI